MSRGGGKSRVAAVKTAAEFNKAVKAAGKKVPVCSVVGL